MKSCTVIKSFFTVAMLSAAACSDDNDNTAAPDTAADNVQQSVIEQIASQMVFVDGGTFMMGQTVVQPAFSDNTTTRAASDSEDDDSPRADELPAHEVTVSDFYIGRYEITQAQWSAVMCGQNPSYFHGDDLPVESVTWNDIQAFLARLNDLTGENYRLPTEAEWEYAARGGRKSLGYRYSGSNDIDEVAWYSDNSPESICPTGGKKPNELGLYDMSGNAFEWVFDWYSEYTSDARVNPKGPSSGTYHVLRGGSWKHGTNGCRVSFRTRIPTYHLNKCGFRIAKGIALEDLPYDDDDTASDFPDFSSEIWTSGSVSLPYRKCVMNMSDDTEPALVIYLHGGSCKGDDNRTQMKEKAIETITRYLLDKNIASVMLVPQCPKNSSWGGSMNRVLKGLIDAFIQNGSADGNRIYIFGGSMGGTGTWSMVSAYPNVFAAAMPVAGNPSASDASKVATTPIYTVMGTADTVMNLQVVTDFVEMLEANNGEIRFDSEDGWTHEETCEQSYTDDRLDWIFGHKKR